MAYVSAARTIVARTAETVAVGDEASRNSEWTARTRALSLLPVPAQPAAVSLEAAKCSQSSMLRKGVPANETPSTHIRFRNQRCTRAIVLSVFLLALTAASGRSIKMVTSWFNPKYEGQKFHKVLVIGIAQDLEVRADFEDEMAAQIARPGMQTIPATRSCCAQTPRRNLTSTTFASKSATIRSTPWSSRVF